MAQPAPINGKGLLTPIQTAFLELFSQVPDHEQFYLTGGTALAEYYLGHRLSFDLDLFTSTEGLVLPTSYGVESLAQRTGFIVQVVRRFNTYIELDVKRDQEKLKIDLALDSPFRYELPVQTSMGVLVNDRKDLQVDKLLAYYGRAEPRDAVDLYFILKEEIIDNLLPLAIQKDPGFDRYWFSIALNRSAGFPDELERWPVKMVIPFDPVRLKADFQALSIRLIDEL